MRECKLVQLRVLCELRGVHGSARCAVWVRAAFFFFFFSLFSFFFASAEAGPGRSCRCLLLRCCSSSFLSLLLFFSAAPSDWGVLIFAGGHARHIRAQWPTAGSWVGALLRVVKTTVPLISGGVVEFEKKGWEVSLSLLELAGLVGDAVLGGVLLGLPRVCSSGWEHARGPSEPDCAGQSAWDHHLLDFISNLQAKSPQGRSPPHAQHEHGTRNNLLKLKWA